ncbi:xanthine dehydrogenase family protein subunit M [Acuticoccus sp. I52.16.1]|uniref:FAD binding domain-containing protein n=1 Tax=Acuticoccus sp. I52.16.1 TaxID=2928472 RepID=UPI001FCFD87F|nr:FAD binding domain-containing protein [Acuticoccus sp. I52.16.1]UOM34973.1 FAD binding domain-containing protein [Acuticoccus sp. I52.16.1]
MPVSVATYDSLSEAGRAFAEHRGARVYSGGTLVMRAVNEGDVTFDRLIRITDRAYGDIAVGSDVRLGGGVTMAQIVAHRDLGFLAPVARVIGGPQVRQVATVAGNLFAPAPYGDLAGALVALGAQAEMVGGSRTPVEELVKGGGSRALVAAVIFPRPQGELKFVKVSRVKPKGVALMSISASIPRGSGEARIVFNGMGPHPMRAVAAERALSGRAGDRDAIARAASQAAEGLDPSDDGLATAWYRREVAGVHLKRLLEAR